MGQISVEVIADIARLRTGLNQGIQLINRFSQQAVRGVQPFATGFQKVATQVQTGAKFMGSEYNKFAITAKGAAEKVTQAVGTQAKVTETAAAGVTKVGRSARGAKPQLDEFTGGLLNIAKHMGKWISFNLTWFATWRMMWLVLRWLKAGVAAIVDFDTAITNLGAITAATQEQLASLEDTAREVGATTKFTAVEVAEAMVDLSKAGFSVSEVNRMIAGTTLLAIGTLSDLTQTTQLVATTLRTFSLQASDATEVANTFAAAITNSRLTIDSLRASMKYIGPIMAEMGYELADTAAVLGVLADRGIEAGISARGLRGFFSALIAPTDKLRRELERVGLSVRDVTPLTNDLAVILSRLKEANFDVESAMRGLERRVGTTAIALVSAGEYFEVLRDAITGTTAAEVIAEKQIKSLGYRLILLKSQATELALDFRDVFLPAIQAVLGGISALLVAINELTSRLVELLNLLPPVARELTIFAGIFGMVSLGIGAFSGKLAAGAGILGIFTFGLKGVWGALLKVLKILGPWGIGITLAIIGFTALVSWLKKSREELTTNRKEIAANVLSLEKQRTELARVLISLEEYRDDVLQIRSVLEGLADAYPEIADLLTKETVTYEEASVAVKKLMTLKTEEARIRREELIEAIKLEMEQRKLEIEQIENLVDRIVRAFPAWKQLLQLWLLITSGTFDANKAIKELNEEIKKLENSLAMLAPREKEQVKILETYAGELRNTALETLELAKAAGITGVELIKYLDDAIVEYRRLKQARETEYRDALTYFWSINAQRYEALEIAGKGLTLQEKWNDAWADPEVEKAQKAYITAEKTLVSAEKDSLGLRRDILDSYAALTEAEKKLWDAQVKRAISEEFYYRRVLGLIEGKFSKLRVTAEREGKWTKENAAEYIKLQQEGYEVYIQLLAMKLRAALTAGKTEEEAIADVQAEFGKYGPMFKKWASDFFEAMNNIEKYDAELVQELLKGNEEFISKWKKIVVKGLVPLWEGELDKVSKAYEEYRAAMLEYEVSVGGKTIEVQIAFLEKRLANEEYWIGKEWAARLALIKKLGGLYNALDKLEETRFKFQRKMGLMSVEDEIQRNSEKLASAKLTQRELLATQMELYSLIKEQEKLLVKDLVKRGVSNAEIQNKIFSLWKKHYEALGLTDEEATKFIAENWEQLAKDMGLIADSVEGDFEIMVDRIANRIKDFFINKGPEWARVFGDILAKVFKTATDAAIDAITDLINNFLSGGDVMTQYTRDQANRRLEIVKRELEEESRLYGENTEKYKELLDEQAQAQKDLAESEHDLLNERANIFRRFVDTIISESLRMLVISGLRWLFSLVFGLGGGGVVPSAKKGGEVPIMQKGGLIKKLNQQLQSFQRGGEVLVRAHEGEYFIPAPIVQEIKHTREVPERLVTGIVTGKPPSYQAGGEVRAGEAGGALTVVFQPGTKFTEIEKVEARQYFERVWLPLWREAQRRE